MHMIKIEKAIEATKEKIDSKTVKFLKPCKALARGLLITLAIFNYFVARIHDTNSLVIFAHKQTIPIWLNKFDTTFNKLPHYLFNLAKKL